MPIPVIDLFAGPGGLGEGFSAVRRDGEPVFKIRLSIEKDESAHRTLELRSFFRQFPRGEAPEDYYDYLCGEISRDELFGGFPDQDKRANAEAWHAELGREDFPDKLVDDRIEAALGERRNWLLIGGPPCQAYSLMGRAKLIGEFGRDKYEADHRHLLYRQYLRIIGEHEPAVFVMENVQGLLTARRHDERILNRILEDLQNPPAALSECRNSAGIGRSAYRLVSLVVRNGDLQELHKPEDFLVCSERYGIPQSRHRIILVGVKAGNNVPPRLLMRQAPSCVEDVISDLPRLRSGLSREPDSAEAWRAAIVSARTSAWFNSPKLTDKHRDAIRMVVASINGHLTRGDECVRPRIRVPAAHTRWFIDFRLGAVCNHMTRLHMRGDLHRYLFASTFACVHKRSPILREFPAELLPDHKNVAEALTERKFTDRFRVQVAGQQSSTITSHISKDGHYFIHYDPGQCRSLTVREAARLQTFPDNYFFEGPRTEQYQQVGNAVPPLLARQIAGIVADLFPQS